MAIVLSVVLFGCSSHDTITADTARVDGGVTPSPSPTSPSPAAGTDAGADVDVADAADAAPPVKTDTVIEMPCVGPAGSLITATFAGHTEQELEFAHVALLSSQPDGGTPITARMVLFSITDDAISVGCDFGSNETVRFTLPGR